MANRHRGEVDLDLGGTRYTLCITLGALAEIESGLGGGDLDGLAARFSDGRLAGSDLIVLLGAALRGGGHPLDDAAVAEALAALHRRCERVVFLGSWPAVRTTGSAPPDHTESLAWVDSMRRGGK